MAVLTRLQLQQRVGDLIADPNNQRWSTSQVQNKLNEGQEAFAVDTVSFLVTTSLTISASNTLALPTDVIQIRHLRELTNGVVLKRTTEKQLIIDHGTGFSTNTSTAPNEYYSKTEAINRTLVLYPTPTNSTITYSLSYFGLPTAMSSDSSNVFTDSASNVNYSLEPFSMGVAYWSAADLLRVQPDQGAIIMLKEYERQYDKLKNDCIDFVKSLEREENYRMRGGRYFKNL